MRKKGIPIGSLENDNFSNSKKQTGPLGRKKGIPISPSENDFFSNPKKQTGPLGRKKGIPLSELPSKKHPQENQKYHIAEATVENIEVQQQVSDNDTPQQNSNFENQAESSNPENPNKSFRAKIKQLAKDMLDKQTAFNEFCGGLSITEHPWLHKYYKLYKDNKKYAIQYIIDEQASYVTLQFQGGYIGTYNIKKGNFEKPVFDWSEDQENDKKFYEVSQEEDKKESEEEQEL